MNYWLWNFSSFDLLEYFHPKKLLNLHANYYQSLTAIETGPKNLEYFIFCLHHFKIRYHYVLITLSKMDLDTRYPKNTNWDILKKTPTYKNTHVMRCEMWYHLYNLKNAKNTHGGVLILVKLQASAQRTTHDIYFTGSQYLQFVIIVFVSRFQYFPFFFRSSEIRPTLKTKGTKLEKSKHVTNYTRTWIC